MRQRAARRQIQSIDLSKKPQFPSMVLDASQASSKNSYRVDYSVLPLVALPHKEKSKPFEIEAANISTSNSPVKRAQEQIRCLDVQSVRKSSQDLTSKQASQVAHPFGPYQSFDHDPLSSSRNRSSGYFNPSSQQAGSRIINQCYSDFPNFQITLKNNQTVDSEDSDNYSGSQIAPNFVSRSPSQRVSQSHGSITSDQPQVLKADAYSVLTQTQEAIQSELDLPPKMEQNVLRSFSSITKDQIATRFGQMQQTWFRSLAPSIEQKKIKKRPEIISHRPDLPLESEFPENIIETCEELVEEEAIAQVPSEQQVMPSREPLLEFFKQPSQETDYELALKSLNVPPPKLDTDVQKKVLVSAMSAHSEEEKQESSEGELRTTTLPRPSLPTQSQTRERPVTKHRRTTSIIIPQTTSGYGTEVEALIKEPEDDVSPLPQPSVFGHPVIGRMPVQISSPSPHVSENRSIIQKNIASVASARSRSSSQRTVMKRESKEQALYFKTVPVKSPPKSKKQGDGGDTEQAESLPRGSALHKKYFSPPTMIKKGMFSGSSSPIDFKVFDANELNKSSCDLLSSTESNRKYFTQRQLLLPLTSSSPPEKQRSRGSQKTSSGEAENCQPSSLKLKNNGRAARRASQPSMLKDHKNDGRRFSLNAQQCGKISEKRPIGCEPEPEEKKSDHLLEPLPEDFQSPDPFKEYAESNSPAGFMSLPSQLVHEGSFQRSNAEAYVQQHFQELSVAQTTEQPGSFIVPQMMESSGAFPGGDEQKIDVNLVDEASIEQELEEESPQRYQIIRTPIVVIDVTLKRGVTEKLIISEDMEAESGELVVDPRDETHLTSTVGDFCEFHGISSQSKRTKLMAAAKAQVIQYYSEIERRLNEKPSSPSAVLTQIDEKTHEDY